LFCFICVALLAACVAQVPAPVAFPQPGAGPLGAEQTALERSAADEKAADQSTAVARTECYSTLHYDLAGTPFIGEIADTAEETDLACGARGAKIGASHR
jgi:hypothetical protein